MAKREIRIDIEDRNRYFNRDWDYIIIELEGETNQINVNLSPSFWRRCKELRSAGIGRWLIKNGLAPWPRYNPPELRLEHIEDNCFKLIKIN